MRFLYADPGLQSNLGHHASSCRFITKELRARGIDTKVFAFDKVDREVQAELSAVPFFRAFTYWLNDGDPICGWLNAYHSVANATRSDLSRLPGLGSGDVLYLNSGQAAQLFGLAQWLNTLPISNVPQVVFEFGVDPGMEVQVDANGLKLSIRDPRIDPRAVLCRHAAQQIPKQVEGRVHLMTFEPNSSAAYGALLGKDVKAMPLPRAATSPPRSRVGQRPITVAVLGHQRPEKGYQFVPALAKSFLQARPNVRLLAHNGDPNGMSETQSALRDLRVAEPRLLVDERLADERIWAELLNTADIILCPYDTARFATSYSAVAADAIANAIPLVVPANTSMAHQVAEFGGAGTVFDKTDTATMVEAVLLALDRFDQIAELAVAAAEKWRHIHGPRCFVDSLLALTSKPAGQ